MKGREQDAMDDAEVCINLLRNHVIYLIRSPPVVQSLHPILCPQFHAGLPSKNILQDLLFLVCKARNNNFIVENLRGAQGSIVYSMTTTCIMVLYTYILYS